jgi:hypothetical protein
VSGSLWHICATAWGPQIFVGNDWPLGVEFRASCAPSATVRAPDPPHAGPPASAPPGNARQADRECAAGPRIVSPSARRSTCALPAEAAKPLWKYERGDRKLKCCRRTATLSSASARPNPAEVRSVPLSPAGSLAKPWQSREGHPWPGKRSPCIANARPLPLAQAAAARQGNTARDGPLSYVSAPKAKQAGPALRRALRRIDELLDE